MRIFGSIYKVVTENAGLKLTALVLALGLWFYIVGELNRGNAEEKQFLNKVLPSDNVIAKKLSIRPVLIGKPRRGFAVDRDRVLVQPEYVIVVGTKDLLAKIRYAYAMPVDVSGAAKPVSQSVSLNPIAPGVFMEETSVQVTVPVERER